LVGDRGLEVGVSVALLGPDQKAIRVGNRTPDQPLAPGRIKEESLLDPDERLLGIGSEQLNTSELPLRIQGRIPRL
jgi:hypothetical protein